MFFNDFGLLGLVQTRLGGLLGRLGGLLGRVGGLWPRLGAEDARASRIRIQLPAAKPATVPAQQRSGKQEAGLAVVGA